MGGGGNGAERISQLLKPDEIQYAGFRVTIASADASSASALHKHVYMQWVGPNVSESQVNRVPQDDAFMRQFFSETDACFSIVAKEFEGEADIAEFIKKESMSLLRPRLPTGTRWGFDFGNADSVEVCTHYDYYDEGDEKALSHDALFNAMRELEEAGESVECMDEARGLYSRSASNVPPAPSATSGPSLEVPDYANNNVGLDTKEQDDRASDTDLRNRAWTWNGRMRASSWRTSASDRRLVFRSVCS